MAHTLDEYEPTPADVIHIQSKALDEKAQTVYRLEQENKDLRTINADLLAACRLADVHVGWGDCSLENVHRVIRAAIAKAEAD